MTDYKQLCADLADRLEISITSRRADANYHEDRDAIDRARAALAEPEPEGPTPSDEDLALIYHDCCGGCEFMDQGGFEDAARAVLACWGRPS